MAALRSPRTPIHHRRAARAAGLAVAAAALLAPTDDVAAQAGDERARVDVVPTRPAPGTLVRVVVRPTGAGGTVAGVDGTLAGEPLHFERRPDGAWTAIGGVPLEATDSLVAPLVVRRDAGAREEVALRIPAPPAERVAARETLRVDARFGQAPDSALAARIADEAARALAVARRAHETPRLWRAAFVRPRETRVTSGFGSGRTFNGTVQTRHTGVDYAGAVGAPVRAANRGVVALVDTFHLAGRAVYVDHGAGVVTGYFHLSRALVAVGDTVRRGQPIGRVGATGRVTGPHLHWMARYGAVTVDPRGLLALPAPSARTEGAAAGTTAR